jgi:hypothetical protein
MLAGKKEYGTWKDGSSIFKDSKGYYVVAASLTKPMYKKYLKGWKPKKDAPQLCLVNKRWTECRKKKVNTTRKKS